MVSDTALGNRFHAPHHLVLRHSVHRVDMVQTRLAVLMSLMHRVHAQVSRPAKRLRFATFAHFTWLARVCSTHTHRRPGQFLALHRPLPAVQRPPATHLHQKPPHDPSLLPALFAIMLLLQYPHQETVTPPHALRSKIEQPSCSPPRPASALASSLRGPAFGSSFTRSMPLFTPFSR